jgi:hypothetical protein
VEECPRGSASFMERGYNPHRRLENQAYSTLSFGTLTEGALLAVESWREVMKYNMIRYKGGLALCFEILQFVVR